VLIDKENAVIIGTAVDELVRHHPSLKHAVFEAIKSTLTQLENIGMTYTPPADIKQWYQLVPVSKELSSAEDVTMQDVMPALTEVEDVAATTGLEDAEGSQSGSDRDEPEGKGHDNIIVSYIDVLGRVSIPIHVCFKHIPLINYFSSWKGFSSILLIARISFRTSTVFRGLED
jgi:E3 ubiquitin-protein ligase HUWE1